MLIAEANRGRLGNQLFTYAFSRLLAEATELRAYIPDVPGFARTHAEYLGSVTLDPPEEFVTDSSELWSSIVERCKHKRVRVRGFFEQSRFYLEHRDKIRSWLKPSITHPPHPDTVIHVRGTDFIGHGKDLPLTYFYRALWQVGIASKDSKVIIVTDDDSHPVVHGLMEAGAVLAPLDRTCPGTPRTALDDFALMLSAKRLVISRSTFSWWAAFLGNAIVAQPTPLAGHPSNLTVLDWLQIPC